MRTIGWLAAAMLAAPVSGAPGSNPGASDTSFVAGQATVRERERIAGSIGRARNVILFVGDGMGVSTVTAARIFEAQQRGRASGKPETGEEHLLSFERLPHTALIKTFNHDAQVPDSAGTGSAMNTGVKTRIGVLNMRPDQGLADCRTPERLPRTIAEEAKARGLAVGVVSTARLTHATPAAVYAHSPTRQHEGGLNDSPPADAARAAGCPDIAAQLIGFRAGGGIDVALGGGLDRFIGSDIAALGGKGRRAAGENLRAAWIKAFPGAVVVEDGPALAMLGRTPRAGGNVLGLFNLDHMYYEVDRAAGGGARAPEPSLTDMTRFAVTRLQARARKGYFLMVEAGRIDHAHHATNRYRALGETVELARAVQAALDLTRRRDTLVLVTADHSHVFTMAGYPARGADILDHVKPPAGGGDTVATTDQDGYTLDEAKRRIPTLAYANGPAEGAIDTPGGRVQLSSALAPTDPNYIPPKLNILSRGETHAGEDVPLYAVGPGAALVGGVLDQTVIRHVIARVLGWR